MRAPQNSCWLWSKISSSTWEDAWEERLRFLPPGAAAFLTRPGSRALRIRAYVDAATARNLHSYFGGSVRHLSHKEWGREFERERKPLRVRDRMVVFSEEAPWRKHLAAVPSRPALFIPPSMAFGTGSHPTTAGCLRLLADVASSRPAGLWHQADLGAGSGILALAGKIFGAGTVEAIDYDRICLREVRRNAKLNRLRLDHMEVGDVHAWVPQRPCHVITANLFSDTLISAGPRLARALAPGGLLIFSGVLREQLGAVLDALLQTGLQRGFFNPRGKWVFGILHKPAQPPAKGQSDGSCRSGRGPRNPGPKQK